MKAIWIAIAVLVVGGVRAESVTLKGNEWNDPSVIQVGTEAPRASFSRYPNRTYALEEKASPWRKSLNGRWKFKWAANPNERPDGFEKLSYNDRSWGQIPVPSNWQLQGHGIPYNVNVGYGFDFSELKAPVEGNEVGSYRHRFNLPSNWKNKKVFLHFGGVNSAFYLWVNGEYAGYSQGSKTPAEFNVTDHLKPGENLIAVQVFRWSDGSLLEDQDTWRLSGIFRDVYLWACDPGLHIKNLKVNATLAEDNEGGRLEVAVDLGTPKDAYIAYELLGPLGESVAEFGPGMERSWTVDLARVKAWSAEEPNLYQLLITLADPTTGMVLEVVPQKVGFRRVEIRDGRFLVNGRDVLIKGVNRPEHDPRTGQVMSRERLIEDLTLMKQYNFNAIRTAHYPNTPLFYDLCDQYGFYVMDEANLETHGLRKKREKFRSFAEDPKWREPHLDRIRRMVERDINHPCVVIWSVGNEFLHGAHTKAAYDWIKQRDPSRPVNSEPAQHAMQEGKTDFASKMYLKVPDLKRRLVNEAEKQFPIVLVEYCHALGNSCGGLKEYWDLFYSDNRAQGAFVWDWRDQGIMQPIPEEYRKESGPEEFAAYGTWFGRPPVPVTEPDNMDGLLFSDGKPTPGMRAVSQVQRYAQISPLNLEKGEFMAKNWYDFSELDDKQNGFVKITRNGKVVATADVEELFLKPREEKMFRVELSEIKYVPDSVYHILFEFRARTNAIPLLKGGELLGWDQFELPISGEDPEPEPLVLPELSIREEGERLALSAATAEYVFDRRSGELISCKVGGQELLKAGPRPDFWRVPTNNDRGAGLGWDSSANPKKKLGPLNFWREAAASWQVESVEVDRSNPRSVVVAVKGTIAAVGAAYSITYTIDGQGEMVVECRLDASTPLPELPRFGTEWQLAEKFGHLEWFGRGPWPTYADRKFEPIGRYRSTVKNNFIDYHRPQENGNKVDLYWFAVMDKNAKGLAFVGEELSCNAQPWSKIAMGQTDYSWKLPRTDRVYINVDLAQMGVGGENSWGALPREIYRLNDDAYRFSYRVVPILEREQLDELMKRRSVSGLVKE